MSSRTTQRLTSRPTNSTNTPRQEQSHNLDSQDAIFDVSDVIPPLPDDKSVDNAREISVSVSNSGPITVTASSDSMVSTGSSSQQPINRVFNFARPPVLYDVNKQLRDFWPGQKRKVEHMTEIEVRDHCKHMELPMARVKKVMKIDEDVKCQMISSDAPLFLAAAAEMFIQEITLRAWQLVEEGRRKTLQKSDIAAAASRHEHFDFLIDIVPREESRKYQEETSTTTLLGGTESGTSQVQYFLTGDGSSGNDVFQLDNGQVLHATPIGQPFPIVGPSGNIEISEMQLPPGIEIVHIPQ